LKCVWPQMSYAEWYVIQSNATINEGATQLLLLLTQCKVQWSLSLVVLLESGNRLILSEQVSVSHF
jgi:hypothetical protein